MSEDHIRIIYDGPAVEDGEMDIAQLAPSLLAFGKLVEALDAQLSGQSGRVRVKVRADLRRGSFDVGVSLDFMQTVKTWLFTGEGQLTVTVLSLLGLNAKEGVVGLIQVVRWLHGRRVVKKTVLVDGNTSLETADGEQLTVSAEVARVVDEPQTRAQLEKFTEPLREDGLDSIRFEDGAATAAPVPLESIEAVEAASFEATNAGDPTSQARFPATYQIKRLYFERGKKWRLSNGAQTILAEIEDNDFWVRVERSEAAFASNDYLVCEVRMDQWLTSAGLKTEYVVERVVKHIPSPKQSTFLSN